MSHSQNSTHYVQVVKPADPRLLWSPPAPIPVGSALGPAQLSATAATPGVFVYSPPAGTLLAPGTSTLSVTFTPDNPNYMSATATVPLTVTPGFQFQLATTPSGGSPILLSPVQPATVGLTLQPLIQSAQSITFKCSAVVGVGCAFSPAAVQLNASSTVPVTLTLTYTPTTASRSLRDNRKSRPATPGDAALLLCLLFACPLRHRRPRTSPPRLVLIVALLALAPAIALYGCGWGNGTLNGSSETITVSASSPQESHSVNLALTVR